MMRRRKRRMNRANRLIEVALILVVFTLGLSFAGVRWHEAFVSAVASACFYAVMTLL